MIYVIQSLYIYRLEYRILIIQLWVMKLALKLIGVTGELLTAAPHPNFRCNLSVVC